MLHPILTNEESPECPRDIKGKVGIPMQNFTTAKQLNFPFINIYTKIHDSLAPAKCSIATDIKK